MRFELTKIDQSLIINYFYFALCIINLVSNYMTEVIQKGKKVPRSTLYPKSSSKRVAKIEMKPKSFKSQFKNANYLALGDSFVNMFLHAENVFFIKMKGKSLKGLAKCDKQERMYIEQWVDAMQPSCELIFNFGQVDLNFVRYYKLANGETYPDETFQQYVEWIASLKRKSIILGILASPIKGPNIYDVLQKYKTLEGVSDVDWELIKEEHKRTEQVRKKWNGLIEKSCKIHGVRFVNVFGYDKQLQQKFIDQNPLTVHLRYLPTLVQVQKQIPHLSIDIKKSLQIEEEYVTEKTNRYYKNIQIIEERKRLESVESQETKTQNNSSKDGTQQVDEQETTKQYNSKAVISGDQLLDAYENGQTEINNQSKQSLLEQINFDQQEEYINYSHVTPDILLQQITLQKQITSYCTPTFLFHIARLLDNEIDEIYSSIQIDAVMKTFLTELILYGIESIDINYQSSEPTWMLDMTQTLSEMVETEQGKDKLTKTFVRILQELFEKSLSETDNILSTQTVTLPIMVRFIISIFQNQSKFQFPLIKDKLLIRIEQILVETLFDALLLPDTNHKKFTQLSCSILMFKEYLYQFMEKSLMSKLEKLKITEDQLCSKFKSVIEQKKPTTQAETQRIRQQFSYLLYQKYPFAVCSQKILTLMDSQIPRRYYQKILSVMVKSFNNKLNSASIDNTFKNRLSQLDIDFHKKIIEIRDGERDPYHKSYNPNEKCCNCGCMLGMAELLMVNQKRKGEKLKETLAVNE